MSQVRKGRNDRIGKKMEIVYVNIGQIIPYENNPRKNEKAVDMVADSIERYGFKVPVVLDRENVIVAGHTRVLAAEQLGLENVPVIYADDLTDEQVKAFRLADNKTGELATWDFDRLEQELEKLDNDLFLAELFPMGSDPVQKNNGKEIDLSEYDDNEFRYECQHCGFRFN